MALGKAAISKHAGSFKARPVHVPAWRDENGDDVVLVRGMTLREFEINQARADEGTATASVLSRCILAEDGSRLFEDADVNMLAELPLAQANEIAEEIAKASGLDPDKAPVEAIKAAVADAEGNSRPTPSGDSASS